MVRRLYLAAAVLACFALVLRAGDDHKPAKDVKIVKTDSGLRYQDLKVGTGDAAKKGQTVEVHYTGWLAKDGKKFDSSVDRKRTFKFALGAGKVIKGWDEGVAGMKAGGKRKLLIPAKLGYGEEGYPDVIPPNAELVFDVELISVK
jgi:FKBP-type peptidyl-prolyl cis-trans isomerase